MSGPAVAIVGAGLVGAAIAFRLAERGARVTVIEAVSPGAGASGRSFGWINASFHLNPDHFRLRLAGMEAHRRLEPAIGPTATLWPGCLWWEEDGAAFDGLAATLDAAGYPARVVGRAEFARIEPAVTAPDRALLFPGEGAADGAVLAETLLAAAAAHGARLWAGTAVRFILTEGNRVAGVTTDAGAVPADHVVLAAGTATPALLAPLGVPLPMLARPGLMLRTAPAPPLLRHILASPAGDIRQDAAGRILMPTEAAHQSDTGEAVAATPDILADAAMRRLRVLIPAAQMEWERVTLAWRPVPGDGLPAIGHAGPDGLYVAVMHSGVTLAPLVGELAAREITGGPDEPLLAPFRPTRFALHGASA